MKHKVIVAMSLVAAGVMTYLMFSGLDEDSEIVTFYVGEDGSEELANEIAQEIAEEFEDVEVEIHQGQQPVYPYLFSVE